MKTPPNDTPAGNKVVLITGASRGIGSGIARAAAAEGYAVLVNYSSSQDRAQSVVDGITQAGGRALAVKADVSVAEDAERLAQKRFTGSAGWTASSTTLGSVASPSSTR